MWVCNMRTIRSDLGSSLITGLFGGTYQVAAIAGIAHLAAFASIFPTATKKRFKPIIKVSYPAETSMHQTPKSSSAFAISILLQGYSPCLLSDTS